MAINFARSGDRFGTDVLSSIPKQFVASRWVGGAAGVPAAGQLAKQDTTATFNDGVVQCVASDTPAYLVKSVNSASTLATGTLTVTKLSKGVQYVMECANTATLGHSVQANGTPGTIPIEGILRDQVKDVAAGSGFGVIVSIPTGAAPYLITVEAS